MFQGEYALDGGLHETTKDICRDIQNQLDRINLYDSIREGIDEAYRGGREDFKYEVIRGLEKSLKLVAETNNHTAMSILRGLITQVHAMDPETKEMESLW